MNIKTLFKLIKFITKFRKDMERTSNIKDKLSTICGAILVLCGPGTGILWTLGVKLPQWAITVALALAGVALMTGYILQGKNPDGSTKTPTQVNELNTQAADTKEIKS